MCVSTTMASKQTTKYKTYKRKAVDHKGLTKKAATLKGL